MVIEGYERKIPYETHLKQHFTDIAPCDFLRFYGYRTVKGYLIIDLPRMDGGMKNSASSIRFHN